MLLGAVLMTGADTLARTIVAPAEMPIGILTAAIGAPFFLGMLLRQREPIGRVVRGPCAALVLTIFGDEQPTLQGMVFRRKTDAVRVPVPPREGLNRACRVARVELRPQDRPVAHTMMEGPGEGLDGPAWIDGAKGRVPTGMDTSGTIRPDTRS